MGIGKTAPPGSEVSPDYLHEHQTVGMGRRSLPARCYPCVDQTGANPDAHGFAGSTLGSPDRRVSKSHPDAGTCETGRPSAGASTRASESQSITRILGHSDAFTGCRGDAQTVSAVVARIDWHQS